MKIILRCLRMILIFLAGLTLVSCSHGTNYVAKLEAENNLQGIVAALNGRLLTQPAEKEAKEASERLLRQRLNDHKVREVIVKIKEVVREKDLEFSAPTVYYPGGYGPFTFETSRFECNETVAKSGLLQQWLRGRLKDQGIWTDKPDGLGLAVEVHYDHPYYQSKPELPTTWMTFDTLLYGYAAVYGTRTIKDGSGKTRVLITLPEVHLSYEPKAPGYVKEKVEIDYRLVVDGVDGKKLAYHVFPTTVEQEFEKFALEVLP